MACALKLWSRFSLFDVQLDWPKRLNMALDAAKGVALFFMNHLVPASMGVAVSGRGDPCCACACRHAVPSHP